MKSCMALFLALLGLAAASSSSGSGVSSESKNPISRVTALLNGLKAKLEEDLKAEEDMFDNFKCWYKTTVETKTASNEAAQTRIDSLNAYIKDIEAGNIEFTTERVDLEKQIEGLNHDLETAKTMRDNEHKDYIAAEGEMTQAITALDKAIESLEEGTKDSSLAQKKSYVHLLSVRHSIRKTLAFTRGLLDAADQKYLERFLNGDPNNPDWKKLNRKATYKMKYQASSGKIKETLKKLKATFEANLEDAQNQEAEAQATYDKLKESKGDMLEKAQQALTDMVKEGGARALTKKDAQAEVDALDAQITADKAFIEEAETSFTTKEKEWEARKELRSKEILAISQALAVLASDDAKDQFTKSFKSQGYLFLQVAALQSGPRKCAARVVSSLAAKSKDPRLSLLEMKVGNEAIDKVITKIDEIVADLEADAETDLKNKEKCETDLSDAAKKARAAALEMDTLSEDIVRAKSEIEELTRQIKEQEEEKTRLGQQVKDLTSQREEEHARFQSDKLEDEKAVSLIEQALTIIKEWKSASLIAEHKKVAAGAPGGVLPHPAPPSGILPAPKADEAVQPPHRLAAAAIKVHVNQQAAKKQNPEYQVDAGEAPPPPPATWADPTYSGAGSEQKGIVGILELIEADVKADIAQGEKEEEDAVTAYDKAKADLEGEIQACESAIDAYTTDKSEKEKTVSDKSGERGTQKETLDSQVELYNGYKPGCDFLLINIDVRTKARTIEIDGLKKAKAILQGADFGDSFLQC